MNTPKRFLTAIIVTLAAPTWAGLQLWLPFDSSSLVGPNLISPDASGFGRDAYLNLAATNVAYGSSGASILAGGGISGGALQLDGVNDFARVLNWSGISGSGARSIVLWVNEPSSTLNPNDIWVGWGRTDATARIRWDFGLHNSVDNTMRVELNSGFAASPAGTAIANGNWHQVAVTYAAAATTVSFYLDGSLFGTGTFSANPVNTDISGNLGIAIGAGIREVAASNGNVNRFVNGLIDDVRIFDNELTPTEISDLYTSTVPEPTTVSLAALGAAALFLRRRARK